MRFMIIVKATKSSEAGALPSEELLAEMGKFNEDLIQAGVLLAADGLQASSKEDFSPEGDAHTGRKAATLVTPQNQEKI